MPRSVRPLAVAGLATLAAAGAALGQAPAHAEPTYGPPYNYTQALLGEGGPPIPLKNQAMLTVADHGYLYRAGQQDSHLTVTLVEGGVRFEDTGTQSWKEVASPCDKVSVDTGVAAVCPMPGWVEAGKPLLLEVWPRLGDDFVDASTMPATVSLAVLADDGADRVRLGDGADFVNGAQGNDRVRGGGANDWLRTGIGDDRVRGGDDSDKIVGSEGGDLLVGGAGSDAVYGAPGNDELRGGDGSDTLVCGGGDDSALRDETDRKVVECEQVASG